MHKERIVYLKLSDVSDVIGVLVEETQFYVVLKDPIPCTMATSTRGMVLDFHSGIINNFRSVSFNRRNVRYFIVVDSNLESIYNDYNKSLKRSLRDLETKSPILIND